MKNEEKPAFSQKLLDNLKKFWRNVKSACHNSAIKFYSWLNRHSASRLEKLNSTSVNKPKNPPSERVSSRPPSVTPNSVSQATSNSSDSSLSTPKTEINHANLIEIPRTTPEFLHLMRRVPRSVLSQRERHVIATVMTFPNIKVSELMLPQSAITYVNAKEVLGPLTLDRLYRSGYQHFPVLDDRGHIIGLIHTTALNSLEIKQTSRADEILDPKVYYLREDYTLNQALAAFLRTNCYFFLVIDRFERIVGMLTYQMIVDYLLGETPSDNFDRDNDRLAVAKRKS